jgi:AraC-like DNA-binding protein
MQPLDTIVFETPLVRAARFRCSASDPRFRDSGPTENFLVVFPRTAVWVRHSGSRAFVADPSLATIYNAGQEYTREPISPDGDRCEWLGVSREIALDIAASFDRRACDRCDTPFIPQYAPVGRELYLAQRALFARFDRNSMDALQAEEAIIGLVTGVIGHAYDRFTSTRVAGFDARDDLVQRAKSLLSRNLSAAQSLGGIAVELGVSPFHLCRVFHERTGSTLHEFKTELRLRAALEMLGSSSLSRVAFELGFSSHSHFTSAMRTRFGRTPSELRVLLS